MMMSNRLLGRVLRVLAVPVAAATVLGLSTWPSSAASSVSGQGTGHVAAGPVAGGPVTGGPVPGGQPGAAAPRLGTWQKLPGAPVSGKPGMLVSVWTGTEMIIHATQYSPAGYTGMTFSYRPATRTWTRLPAGPRARSPGRYSPVR